MHIALTASIFLVSALCYSESASVHVKSLIRIAEKYHFSKTPDYDKARSLYLQAVTLGSAEAANHLARMYMNGEGVIKDENEAKKWYIKSVQLDSSLNNRCINGLHSNQALCGLIMAAQMNESQAQVELGKLYLMGTEDLNKDEKKAYQLFKAAAHQHNKNAALFLSNCYENGWGVKKDLNKASMWKKQATFD